MQRIRIGQDGPNVIISFDGKPIEMPWNAALDVSKALTIKARAAEEIAKAEGIIFDQALLVRTGAPLGFTDNPDIQKEAAKEAGWNSKLRRFIPGGVHRRSQERGQLGSPTISQERNGQHGNR